MVRKRGSSLTTAPSLQGGRLSNPLPQPLPPNPDQVILLPMYNYESHRIYYSKSIEMLSIKSKVGKLILEFRIRYQQRWLSLGRCYCHLADIFHTTFSNAFCWMKMFEFSIQFDWSLLKGQIDSNKISIDSDIGLVPIRRQTIIWTNDSWLVYWRIYVIRPQWVKSIYEQIKKIEKNIT